MSRKSDDKIDPDAFTSADTKRLDDELAQAVELSYGRRLSTAIGLTEEERKRIREKQVNSRDDPASDNPAFSNDCR
jgi:hypothetical protein